MKRILLLVETSRGYGRGVMKGISQYAREHGQWSIQFEDRGLLETSPSWLAEWQGDGIISRCATSSMTKVLDRMSIPHVELLDPGSNSVAEVHSDDNALGSIAANYFLYKGFSQFAFFSFGDSWWSRERRRSFEETLAKRGIIPHIFIQATPNETTVHHHWKRKWDRSLEEWMLALPKPCALWATTDEEASRVHTVCQQTGIRIPAEIALLGTSNDNLICNLPYPNISSIDTNSYRVGYIAADLLNCRILGLEEPKTPIAVQPIGVIPRGSTDMVPIGDEDVVQAIQMIREQNDRGVTVNEIANALGISRRTLERKFLQYTGSTPKQELIRTGIDQAKHLLRETTLPLTAIGFRCGFNSLRYFIAAFRRETGMSPNIYRNQMKVSDSD